MGLDGRVALVTAAAGAGIGRAAAQALAADGADVVVTDRHERRTMDAAKEIAASTGRKVIGIPLDVTDESAVEDAVSAAVSQLGHIDILVNNSGYNELAPIWELTTKAWHAVLDTSLTGHFFVLRAVLARLVEQHRAGSVIEVASVSAWRGPDEGSAAYAAAKAGVMALTRAAAAEVAPHGIRVNAVAPGLIYNEFLERIYPPEFFERARTSTPLQRIGAPEDVADAIVFLASERSKHITGEVMNISGGQYFHA